MRSLLVWILIGIGFLVLLGMIAGGTAYGDPLYYSYSYTPWVPWSPPVYSYYYHQPGWTPGHYYAPSTTIIHNTTTTNTTIQNAPGKPTSTTRRIAVGTPIPVAPTAKGYTPPTAKPARPAPTAVKARVQPAPTAKSLVPGAGKTTRLPPPSKSKPPARNH